MRLFIDFQTAPDAGCKGEMKRLSALLLGEQVKPLNTRYKDNECALEAMK